MQHVYRLHVYRCVVVVTMIHVNNLLLHVRVIAFSVVRLVGLAFIPMGFALAD